jgi:Family of unknown function (DUF6519)
MKGDFSRDTFDPLKHFSRVLMQQGRVQLDSDWNEQTSLLWHFMRALATDLIGPHGGPADDCGFRVINAIATGAAETADTVGSAPLAGRLLPGNFIIGSGRYYVGGLLCENERVRLYAPSQGSPVAEQGDLLAPELAEGGDYFVYLDAWEQHVTAFEDDSIREVALGSQGPDTATRARVAWQVRTLNLGNAKGRHAADFTQLKCDNVAGADAWNELVAELQPENRGRLRAKADEPDDTDSSDPCIISPDARFRGAENQLYRVEIHRPGAAGTGDATTGATFKWSRENGSVVLPVRNVSGTTVTLDRMGRDSRSTVEVGDWVEVYDESSPRVDLLTPLLRVTEVDPVRMSVRLSGEPHAETDRDGRPTPPMKNPLLRRWDQKEGTPATGGTRLNDGAALIREGDGDDNWVELEDGVRIQFVKDSSPSTYRAGDYWVIPARTETGDVEWPGEVGRPEPRPPHGVQHFYAPLTVITVAAGGAVTVGRDLRKKFAALAVCK